MREVSISVALGVVLAFAAFGLIVACSSAVIPELVRRKLDALRALPEGSSPDGGS